MKNYHWSITKRVKSQTSNFYLRYATENSIVSNIEFWIAPKTARYAKNIHQFVLHNALECQGS